MPFSHVSESLVPVADRVLTRFQCTGRQHPTAIQVHLDCFATPRDGGAISVARIPPYVRIRKGIRHRQALDRSARAGERFGALRHHHVLI